MSRTLRSLRVMSDYLERHPEALLMGKENSEEKLWKNCDPVSCCPLL